MKLLLLQEVNLTHLDRRFKQSPLASLVATLIFMSLTVGIFCWVRFGAFPLGWAVFSGGFLFLIGLVAIACFKRSLSPANWILAIGPNRILVKFRSYLNAHFPDTDPQVVQFSPTEIGSTRITKQRITSVGSGRSRTTSFHTFLDLQTNAIDLSPLKDRLKYERTVKVERGHHVKTRSKSHHYPVSVVDDTIVRIEWRSPSDLVMPRISKAIDALRRLNIAVVAVHRERIDVTGENAENRKSMDDKILTLARRGNRIAAARLARRAYKLSLAESRQFVEDLLK